MNWKALRTLYLVFLLLFVGGAVLFFYPVYRYLRRPPEPAIPVLLEVPHTSGQDPLRSGDPEAASIDPKTLLQMSPEMVPKFEGMVQRVAPDSAEARVGLGVLYQFKGMNAEAVRCYKKAIELAPSLPDAHYRLGTAYMEIGLKQDAVAEFEETLRINPKYVFAYFSLAALRQNEGRWEAAERLYQKSLEIRPRDYQAYNNLGIVYEAQGLHEKALKAYEKAYALNSSDPVVKENLTQVQGHAPAAVIPVAEEKKNENVEKPKPRPIFKPEKVSTIYLKNKRILSGAVLERDAGGLWFEIDRGTKVYVTNQEIERIEGG